MAALLLLAPLLLLGTAQAGMEGEAQEGMERCPWLWNATEGNFSVATTPGTYQANTTYLVIIKDDRNHNISSQYLLQALSPQNASVGQWEGASTRNCSSLDTAILKSTQNSTNWTSPASSLSSVQIRVYLSLPDNSTELKTLTLNKGAETTTLPATTTPNAVCRAGSSPLVPAALLLLTATLLS